MVFVPMFGDSFFTCMLIFFGIIMGMFSSPCLGILFSLDTPLSVTIPM